MLKNYFKIAFRNLSRNKMFSFINIFGLALSMSVCLLVLMRIKDQVGYDKFHPRPERTYRLITEVTNKQGSEYRLATTPLPLAPTLSKDYNLTEKFVRLYPSGEKRVSADKKELSINAAFADPGFFDIFGFTLQAGDPRTALTDPNRIIINSETAFKFFGTENPIGQTLSFEDFGSFEITGVLNKAEGKSHIEFDAFISMSSVSSLEKSGKVASRSESWNNGISSYTYVVLESGTTENQLATAVSQISSNLRNKSKLEGKENFTFDIQPLNDIILGEDLVFTLGNVGSRGKVMAEIAISFIILLSACFNYTNLSLARSLKRGKEVGVRKVAGAFRFQIFLQFVIESVFIALLSLVLAYTLLKLIIDYAPFSSEMVPPGASLDMSLFIWFVLFSLFTGLLAGVLPAWALSAFKPVDVLKNLSNIKLFGTHNLRKGLIIVQFTLSLIIIIFTLTFFKQFHYMATADPGFDVRNVLNIPLRVTDYTLLANDIAQLNGVERVSATSTNIGKGATGSIEVKQQPEVQPIMMDYYDVDGNFIANMKLALIAGNTFSKKTSADEETDVILTETAVKILKFKNPHEAVGKVLWLDDSIQVQVAAVLQDFYYRGLETPYTPLMLRNRPKEFNYLNVRTREADDKTLVAAIEKLWKQINPNQPLDATWLHEDLYSRKAAWGTVSMLGFLALISITLACLGLLGMVVYNTETRKKEIGIRKVMGASVAVIIALLSKNFMRLVIVAGLIAMPISYLLSYFFLSMFANRINQGFGILAFSFVGMLLLSLLTIGSQIYKVAVANPVNSLRTE